MKNKNTTLTLAVMIVTAGVLFCLAKAKRSVDQLENIDIDMSNDPMLSMFFKKD